MKLLLVEKDNRLAKNLKKNLEKENFAVDFVEEGKIAEKRAESFRDGYDLIVVDLDLPDMSGIELCKKMREAGIKIPILVISRQTNIEERIRALDNGADDYIIEPFSVGELAAKIQALLRRPKETLPFVFRIGKNEFKIIARRVYKNGKEIRLTPKEFSIFEFLLRHPDQIVSREQIMDNAWAFDFNSLSNVIDVHVKNLRKKISDSREDDIIETVWGFGYRLKKTEPGENHDQDSQSPDENKNPALV